VGIGGVAGLNALSRERAIAELLKCCGSKRWAECVTDRRPFEWFENVCAAADAVWWDLGREDWLEAFAHHPRIGQRDLSAARFAPTREWAGKEQAGMAGASDEVRLAFARGSEEYERTFGHVFLICATGKSGEEMLRQLRERLGNDAETELRMAAAEQAKITRLRLEKLLA
jgi:OHCU decarboxylase